MEFTFFKLWWDDFLCGDALEGVSSAELTHEEEIVRLIGSLL
jgi:hypothetical protein